MGLRGKFIPVRRRVWRITEAAPHGEIVDAGAPKRPEPRVDDEAPTEGGWARSSHDLLDGLEVSENPDTLPGELFDELFKR